MRPAVIKHRGIPPRRLWLLTFLLVRPNQWNGLLAHGVHGVHGSLAPWPVVLSRWSPSRCNQSKRAAYHVEADATAILFPETRACRLHRAGDTWSLVFTFLAQSLDSVPPLCYLAGGLRSAKPLGMSLTCLDAILSAPIPHARIRLPRWYARVKKCGQRS